MNYNLCYKHKTQFELLGKSHYPLHWQWKGSSATVNCPVFPLCVCRDLRTSHTIPDCLALDQRYSVLLREPKTMIKEPLLQLVGSCAFFIAIPPPHLSCRHVGWMIVDVGSDPRLTVMIKPCPQALMTLHVFCWDMTKQDLGQMLGWYDIQHTICVTSVWARS